MSNKNLIEFYQPPFDSMKNEKSRMVKWNASPLPFQGQKRNFVRKFRSILKWFPDDATYIDVFGGSGLLSHNVKYEKPEARVIYNDFDHFMKRILNIDRTNKLLKDIRRIISVGSKKRIPEDTKLTALQRIEKEKGYIDFNTLSSNILFSGNYALNIDEISKSTWYNKITKKMYDSTGYLQGVEVIRKDYLDIFQQYNDSKNIYILDPPYMSTDVSTYNNDRFWKLSDYLDIIVHAEGLKFIYFSSEKSQIIELCHWLGKHYGHSLLDDTVVFTTENRVSYSAGYKDIMIVKK